MFAMRDPLTSETPATGPSLPEWERLQGMCNLVARDFTLEIAVRLSLFVPGHIVEFGVYQGQSTMAIRRALDKWSRAYPRGLAPRKRIFACDSFQGLPEKYEKLQEGAFACAVPDLPGVDIVKGYFQDSLTPELAREVGAVSFAHLDADLYSSTTCALTWLTPLLHTGSLLLFDEFLGEQESEKRALEDWSRKTGLQCLPVAEFLRPPSGHGDRLDKRALYQVLGPEPGLPGGAEWRPEPLSFRERCGNACRRIASWFKR